MRGIWPIDELQALVALALEAPSYNGPASKRIRAVPDARTIRYYTTIGLIDRPLEMQGRTAMYGRRHVLQLVAIKRLQAAGLSLADVQQTLAGVTTRRLTELAELPNDFWDRAALANGPKKQRAKAAPAQKEETEPDPSPRERQAFWAAPARPAAADLPLASPSAPVPCVRLPVADGVSLEMTGIDLATAAVQIESLRPALTRLANELQRLGLLSNGGQPGAANKHSTPPVPEEET